MKATSLPILAYIATFKLEVPFFLSLLAGLLGGIWPFINHKSGLGKSESAIVFVIAQAMVILVFYAYTQIATGNTGTMLISLVLAAALLWFTIWQWNTPQIDLRYAIIAACLGAMCLISLMGMMKLAPEKQLATYIACMIGMQTITTMAIHFYQNPKDFSIGRCGGLIGMLISMGAIYKKW